ncbi:MAG: single-stranded DNA-binding protein [Methylobacter sp.]|nr:single-stranded DNA-binding protein [Methylobacter sp.]
MIDALISGKLIKTPELRTVKTGNYYAQFILSVATGDEQPTIISGIAFAETAERIARLQKGDPLAVIGSLKPSEWIDKNTGETKHGLNITANNALSPYDIKKRKPVSSNPVQSGCSSKPFNDAINF